MFPTFKQRCNFVSNAQKTFSAQYAHQRLLPFTLKVLFYNIEWEWASFSESLIQFGSLGSCHKTLVVSSEIFQKNPLCAIKRRRAGVISRSRVYYCNEFAFYIFPVYSSVVARYLRSTCCKSTFQAPTLSWYRQVKNFRIGCSSKSKINFCDLAT